MCSISRGYSFETIEKDIPPKGAPTEKFQMEPLILRYIYRLKGYTKRKTLAKIRSRYVDPFESYLGSKFKKDQFSKYCYSH